MGGGTVMFVKLTNIVCFLLFMIVLASSFKSCNRLEELISVTINIFNNMLNLSPHEKHNNVSHMVIGLFSNPYYLPH